MLNKKVIYPRILFFLTALSFSLTTLATPVSPESIFYNVTSYGTKGDGNHLDSKAINKAINVPAAVGGGTVYFPAGSYLTGSIHLQNNITL